MVAWSVTGVNLYDQPSTTGRAGSGRLGLAVKANTAHARIIGHEILRRIEPSEVPNNPLDPRKTRAVLGAQDERYLVPPQIDVFELGLIDRPGAYELLPIDTEDKPLWDGVVHLLVTKAQAKRQRALLMRAYDALHALILEANALDADITEWSQRRATHPIFGILRLETIEVWKSMRRGGEPLTDSVLRVLHMEVARRVTARIGAHFR